MDDPNIPSDLKRAIQDNIRQFRTLGIALIVLGVAAILFPLFASIAIKVLLGWFFLLTGGAVLWHAFQARDWSSALLSGLVGVVHLAIGVYLAFFPLTGLIGLTMLMAIVFLFQGALEAGMAWQHRPGHGNAGPGWAWMGLSAAVTIVLGLMLLAGLPGTALWALGLFLGINFLTSGISFVVLANAASKF
ncbi:DUF308 domain-containing protein [Mesobacterium sp. TK19101]|uniref:DUF308 domain-containing protein n=1 Tax=Mesobacterium hydrothermale TaxID=3111907 RepID=A0ABU6HG53_9RHOB|nr:DUF308 domain-containing protein [Mesobacterium sp. TK19101]MEC3861397.1 DUF308 domain-containing protein [Mesobacterium sp. TK19101]